MPPVMLQLAPVLFLLVPVNSLANIQNTLLIRNFGFKTISQYNAVGNCRGRCGGGGHGGGRMRRVVAVGTAARHAGRQVLPDVVPQRLAAVGTRLAPSAAPHAGLQLAGCC